MDLNGIKECVVIIGRVCRNNRRGVTKWDH